MHTRSTYSLKLQTALDGLRPAFKDVGQGFAQLTRKRAELAPAFVKAYTLWKRETRRPFVAFVHALDPSVPGHRMKIPHMGWNRVRIERPAPILAGLPEEPFFYFVHSYYVAPADPDVTAATTLYGSRFTSVIWRDNLFATQFHPEKSQAVGLTLLKNFAALAK